MLRIRPRWDPEWRDHKGDKFTGLASPLGSSQALIRKGGDSEMGDGPIGAHALKSLDTPDSPECVGLASGSGPGLRAASPHLEIT